MTKIGEIADLVMNTFKRNFCLKKERKYVINFI